MPDWFSRFVRERLAGNGDSVPGLRQFFVAHRRQVWVVAGVLAVALAVVLVDTLSGPGTPPPASNAAASAQHAASLGPLPVPVTAAELAKLPRATTYASIPAAPTDPDPFAATSGLVVRPLTPQIVYAAPGKAPVAVLPSTELGGPTWVPIVQTSEGWERVLLPSKPNRASGWIYTGATNGSHLDTRITGYLIRVETRARKISVFKNGRSLGTWTVAVGAPATPTPTGRTFLLASLAPAHPTYSPLILPLGFHSNTLDSFGGGPGTVGVHGWPNPSVFGQAVSHGCVRVPAAALHVLAVIPLGSLVLITQ